MSGDITLGTTRQLEDCTDSTEDICESSPNRGKCSAVLKESGEVLTIPRKLTDCMHSVAGCTATEAIEEIVFKILQPIPRVVVINVLPGIGKINTFLKILHYLNVLKTSEDPLKLLFCAKCPGVLDIVGHKFLWSEADVALKNRTRCIRLGKKEDVHPCMQSFSINYLVKLYVEMIKKHELKPLNSEIQSILVTTETTKSIFATVSGDSAIYARKLEKDIDNYEKLLAVKRKEVANINSKLQELHRRHENEAKCQIMASANIILTPLADCDELKLTDAVSGKEFYIPRTCCIIDGANECTELEILPTMLTGIQKLVLIGDSSTAPETLSKLMEKLNKRFEETGFKLL